MSRGRDVPPENWSIPEVRIFVFERTDGRTDGFEEESISRGTDCPRPAPGGSGHAGRRGLPQAGGERADVLPLEAAVCRDGHRRAATAAAGRGREPQTQAVGGGPLPRQAHVAGGASKQRVKPAQKRAVVRYFRAGFQVSERRACRIAGVPRSSCRYRSVAADQTALRLRLRDLAATRVRSGALRLPPPAYPPPS